jgi:hypothetical protein
MELNENATNTFVSCASVTFVQYLYSTVLRATLIHNSCCPFLTNGSFILQTALPVMLMAPGEVTTGKKGLPSIKATHWLSATAGPHLWASTTGSLTFLGRLLANNRNSISQPSHGRCAELGVGAIGEAVMTITACRKEVGEGGTGGGWWCDDVMGAPPQLQVAGRARMSVKEDEVEAELAEGGDEGGGEQPVTRVQ